VRRSPHMRAGTRHRGQRGATLVEYALGLAAVAAAVTLGVQGIEGAAGDELARKRGAGSPDLEELYAESVTTVPTTTTPEGPSTTVATDVAVRVTSDGVGVSTKGKSGSWIATAMITVTDATTGAPVADSVVTGRWAGGSGGDTSCITQSDGSCPVTLSGLKVDSSPSVTFTVVGVSSVGLTRHELPPVLTIKAP
jgi:hypothetical protein